MPEGRKRREDLLRGVPGSGLSSGAGTSTGAEVPPALAGERGDTLRFVAEDQAPAPPEIVPGAERRPTAPGHHLHAERRPIDAVWDYEDDLQRLSRQLCGQRQDAEDVAHSSLVKAVEHLEGFRSEASLRTWLHRIATNECAMLRRRPSADSLDAQSPGDWQPRPDNPRSQNPETAVVEAAERRAVLDAVRDLPWRERVVLLLAAGQGLPAAEVARQTGLSLPAVRAVLYRARRRIRKKLGVVPGGPGQRRTPRR
jgi:RNA polymerase sigma factor (sigma-70 family)